MKNYNDIKVDDVLSKEEINVNFVSFKSYLGDKARSSGLAFVPIIIRERIRLWEIHFCRPCWYGNKRVSLFKRKPVIHACKMSAITVKAAQKNEPRLPALGCHGMITTPS